MLEVNSTNCCAVNQLHHLHTQIDPVTKLFDPKGAIKAIFKSWSDYQIRYGSPSIARSVVGTLRSYCHAHYIFTGVVELKGNIEVESRGAGCNDLTYGPALAAFIKKNKLGKVIVSPQEVNRVNHPNHFVKVWVWTPDLTNLEAWFIKNVFPEEIERVAKEKATYEKKMAEENKRYEEMRAAAMKDKKAKNSNITGDQFNAYSIFTEPTRADGGWIKAAYVGATTVAGGSF